MRTVLPTVIESVEAAKVFMTLLHNNGEAFDPEEDAYDIDWSFLDVDEQPSELELVKLNMLMDEMLRMPGFEVQEFLMDLEINAL